MMVRTMLSRRALVLLGVWVIVAPALAKVPSRQSRTKHHIDHQRDDALACDAFMNGQSVFENREDMEMEERIREVEFPTASPTASPSESPSMSPPCSDPFSNARGSYTSSKAPCVISFHNEDEGEQKLNPTGVMRQRYHDGDDDSILYYHGTSNVCGADNKIGGAKEYVMAWPDECVGDFARCYDLRDPNHLLCQSLKKVLEGLRDLRRLEDELWLENELSESERLPWTKRGLHDALVPPGTTHVSIDCTADKEAVMDSYQRQIDLEQQKMEETISVRKNQTLFMIVCVLVAVLIVIFAISQLVVQPIVGAIGDACGSRRGGGSSQQQLVSLVSHSSGLQIDTIDSEGGDGDQEEGIHHRHVQDDLQTLQTATETTVTDITVTETVSTLTPTHVESIESIPMDFDAVPIAPTTPHVESIESVRMDFDAVPIVPATIISIEALEAQVMLDGVTYYE